LTTRAEPTAAAKGVRVSEEMAMMDLYMMNVAVIDMGILDIL
jgi:hypothetical protein